MIILQTPRLTIRHLTPDDAPFMLALLNDPDYIRFIADRGVRTVEAARQNILQGAMASYERFGFGLFLVELQETGIPIGICGLIKRDTLPDVDLGYAFLPDFRGQGYAYEAAAAMLVYGPETHNLKQLLAITSLDNASSIRLLHQLGFQLKQILTWPDGSQVNLFQIIFQ